MSFLSSFYFITIVHFLILKWNQSFNKIIHLYTYLWYLHSVVRHFLLLTYSIFQAFIPVKINLSRIPTNNYTEWRSGWTKIPKRYKKAHPNLPLILLFVCTKWNVGNVFPVQSVKSSVKTMVIRHWGCSNLFPYCFLNTNLIGFLYFPINSQFINLLCKQIKSRFKVWPSSSLRQNLHNYNSALESKKLHFVEMNVSVNHSNKLLLSTV